MFENSRNSRKLTSRWRSIFIALILAFGVGSAGQIAPVQAAPARDSGDVFMRVVNPKTTICAGSTQGYEVVVWLRPPPEPDGTAARPLAQSGIKVEATSTNKSVGDFARSTSTSGLLQFVETGDEGTPYTAYFAFKANKAGETTVFFEGVAFGEYVSDSMRVKVINCKFRVSAISRWSGSNQFSSMKMIAITGRPAMLELAAEGGSSTVSTNVAWVEVTRIPNYSETNDLRFGTLEVKGEIGSDDSLLLTVTLKPVTFKQKICGQPGCGGGSLTSTADKLELWVSSDYGGSVTHTIGLTDQFGTMFGPMTVYVIPVLK